MMQVILLERIERLGQMGDVVNVKPGYARNYLLPSKKAMRATEENRKQFEAQRAQLEAVNLERRTEASAVAEKMDGLMISLIRQAGDAGQLYGSVSARDVADSVSEAGFTIDRTQVRLAPPIKTTGIHDVAVALHSEVMVTVRVNVARSAEEAEIQATTGTAVRGSEDIEATEAEEAVLAAEEIFEGDAPEELVEDAEAEEDEEDKDETA